MFNRYSFDSRRFTVSGRNWIHVVNSAGLMPTEDRGNYLPEAAYLRETKTYLNCNSRMHGYIEHA